ncbi:MAG: ferritin-like domain-containing protein [Myxococcota bacterium]
MKTTQEVAELAHELMLEDLVASETYLVYAMLIRDWGYAALAAHFEHESLHERQHATLQLERLTYLDVPIDLSRRPASPPTPESPRACLEASLEMEVRVAEKLRELCVRCVASKDEGTRQLAETLLVETEMDHILWLEQQLRMIGQLGEAQYLAQMIHGEPANGA